MTRSRANRKNAIMGSPLLQSAPEGIGSHPWSMRASRRSHPILTRVSRTETLRASVLALAMMTVASACRPRTTPPTASTTAPSEVDAAPSAKSPAPPRVVCAPEQGPTRLSRSSVDRSPRGAEVASVDGGVALFLISHSEIDATGHEVELRGRGEPGRSVRIPAHVNPTEFTFRGTNVIGFGASKHHFGGDGFIVWATVERPAVFTRAVASSAIEVGQHVYFADASCRLHAIDLETGDDVAGAVKTCLPFRVWGDAIAIPQLRYSTSGLKELVGYDYGRTVVDPLTGKPRPKPYCPHSVGASCITLDSDLHWELNDDPAGPASEPSRSESFEVRGLHGEHVKGEIEIPHPQLSPDHVELWRDARGRTMAFVAAHVEGLDGAHLVVVDDAKVSITALSAEEEIDQRRITALQSFVPWRTRSADVDALVRERQAALAAVANDRVRFMAYPAAASANIPCTPPPR